MSKNLQSVNNYEITWKLLLQKNFSDRQMDLHLKLESNSTLAWIGISDKMIGTLKSRESIDIPLSFIPLESGLIVRKTFYDRLFLSLPDFYLSGGFGLKTDRCIFKKSLRVRGFSSDIR